MTHKQDSDTFDADSGSRMGFRAEYSSQAGKLCEMGFIEADLAYFFEVDENTIREWKRDHPEFRSSIEIGKDVAVGMVEYATFKRAIGYDRLAKKVIKGKVFAYREHVPADTHAQIKWLQARRPQERARDNG